MRLSVLFSTLLLVAQSVLAQDSSLTDVQDYIYRKSYQLAVNAEVQKDRQYLVTHQELNEVVELVRRYQLKTKDVLAIYQAVQNLAAKDGGSDRENIARDDLRRIWGMIFSVRITMDTHEMNPNWLCLFKPIASPLDAVSEDSIQNHPERFPLSKKEIEQLTIRDNDRVIVAICGPRIKREQPQAQQVDSVVFTKPQVRAGIN